LTSKFKKNIVAAREKDDVFGITHESQVWDPLSIQTKILGRKGRRRSNCK